MSLFITSNNGKVDFDRIKKQTERLKQLTARMKPGGGILPTDLKPTVDMKLSLSPINLKCSDKIAKDEILIHDENVSVPDINNICEKNVIEQKLENSNVGDKIQLCDSNQAVKHVFSSDKRSSNTLKELKNDQRINYENFKISDAINNYETNSMDKKQDNPDIDGENQTCDNSQDVVSDFTLKYDSSAPITSSREDCNYNVKKGFFPSKTTSAT